MSNITEKCQNWSKKSSNFWYFRRFLVNYAFFGLFQNFWVENGPEKIFQNCAFQFTGSKSSVRFPFRNRASDLRWNAERSVHQTSDQNRAISDGGKLQQGSTQKFSFFQKNSSYFWPNRIFRRNRTVTLSKFCFWL